MLGEFMAPGISVWDHEVEWKLSQTNRIVGDVSEGVFQSV